ncbi:hypothetical protein OG898_10010 [Streptomyces sp. NBC_00193]|uniref:hypothetical protein n=1 Tax=unclassified Streptomyces TaxID=2593676 RepID=UPI002251B943|nr:MULTISPECIES: hypothetical protein [unclassified Streptomyces]MCX5123475.1 hypothetical protein [Streptomyces sp. NBC_00347]MCX5296823.1 hypothetical protein [Streptomyces sp. NBC_00193]
MTTQPSPDDSAWEAKLRRAGLTSFLVAAAASFAFFAFFPGLPHVIDWGAIVTSLAVGALARWARRSHLSKRRAAHPQS